MRRSSSMIAFFLLVVIANGSCAITNWFTSTSSEFVPPDPESLQARITLEGTEPNGQVDHFAVLIGADTSILHRGNLSMAYQVLLEQGYARDRIYILDSEGENPFFPLTDTTSRMAITMLFRHLAKIVEPHDTLFVYVTGNGRVVTAEEKDKGAKAMIGQSTLMLNPGEELSQPDFSAMLEKIAPEAGIVFLDQCYWGEFTSPKLCNFVIITTSEAETSAQGTSFPRAFWGAFRDRRSAAGPPTILDAFKFAMVADRPTTLGQNRPRIAHNCVNPSDVTLLGSLRTTSPE